MSKICLVSGITGQTGSYLADKLIARGDIVHGIIRRSSSFNTERIDHLYYNESILDKKLFLHYGDLTDSSSLRNIIFSVRPDIVFHLAAQSHVRISFDIPEYTFDTIANGTIRILEAVKDLNKQKLCKFYNAGSSEQFGDVLETPQKETTPFNPMSPYACAKVAAYCSTVNYRKAYGMFASNGILMNHESERRSPIFVTRKITVGLSEIICGRKKELVLGNLDAKRDWGYAPDYCDGILKIIDHTEPDDFVLATGETHSVREFLDEAGKVLNIDWKKYVRLDKRYERPSEVNLLLGDASKAKRVLGWEPKVKFKELVKIMAENDLALSSL